MRIIIKQIGSGKKKKKEVEKNLFHFVLKKCFRNEKKSCLPLSLRTFVSVVQTNDAVFKQKKHKKIYNQC